MIVDDQRPREMDTHCLTEYSIEDKFKRHLSLTLEALQSNPGYKDKVLEKVKSATDSNLNYLGI